ncbi:MAG: hypothetical protein WC551_08320 [Patescibacteria group bacterium]
MPLLNYTTRVDSQRTASEIMAILAKHRAKQILTEYGPNGEVSGLAFMVQKGDRDLAFRLPVRTAACLQTMRQDYAYEMIAGQGFLQLKEG